MTTPAPPRVVVHLRVPALPADAAASAAPAAQAADAPPPGARCGWFHSSWELDQGLQVSELPDSDGCVAALWFATLAAPSGASARLQ